MRSPAGHLPRGAASNGPCHPTAISAATILSRGALSDGRWWFPRACPSAARFRQGPRKWGAVSAVLLREPQQLQARVQALAFISAIIDLAGSEAKIDKTTGNMGGMPRKGFRSAPPGAESDRHAFVGLSGGKSRHRAGHFC